MKVAFLFPLHDEEKRIQLTLKFIKFANKNFKNHKFVFLLNNCKDKTEKIINIKFKKIRNKIILKSKIKNRGAGLNKAFKKLKVKYFAVCAVDNAWDFNFYKAAYKLLENGKAKINPSALSNNPPCPGMILPVSFIFEKFLKYFGIKIPYAYAKNPIRSDFIFMKLINKIIAIQKTFYCFKNILSHFAV